MAALLVALVAVLSIAPFTVSASTGSSDGSQGCTVNWSTPSGTYIQGETESAVITTTCTGNGAWLLCQIAPPSILTCLSPQNIVDHGTFSCPCPSGTTLFSLQLPVGNYLFVAIVGTQVISSDLAVSIFQVVTPQFPAGVVTAVITPIAALGGYWLFAKKRQPAV